MNDLTTEYFDLRLRIKLPKTSSEAILLRYLFQQKRLMPSHHKNMILKALAAFWLPLAYKHENKNHLVSLTLQETICCFKKHIKYLEDLLNLDEVNCDLNSFDSSLNDFKSLSPKNGEQITQEQLKVNEFQDDGSYISVIQVQDF